MVLSDMVCGCVRGCLECCGIFCFVCFTRKGGRRPVTIKINTRAARWGGREVIMEWEFINSVTIQLAKIVFQNFLCEEIKMKNAKYDDILNQ